MFLYVAAYRILEVVFDTSRHHRWRGSQRRESIAGHLSHGHPGVWAGCYRHGALKESGLPLRNINTQYPSVFHQLTPSTTLSHVTVLHKYTQNSVNATLLPGLGPLFLYGRRGSWEMGVVWGVATPGSSVSWAAVEAARAFSSAMVSLFGRRPLMPFRTGSWGRGVGRR